MRTTIVFDSARVPIEQVGVTATVGRFPTPRRGWAASVGAIVDGTIEGRDLVGGATAAFTVAWLPVYERPRRPFVGVTGTVGAAWLAATSDDGPPRNWLAFDLRVGGMVGKTIARRYVPYAAARLFGGPVVWRRGGERVIGGDRYHVSLGGGAIVRLPGAVDLVAEVMPLGEQTAALGLTLHR